VGKDVHRDRTWARQWKHAGTALAAIRARDLGTLSAPEALQASDELLALALATPLPPWRREWSGLVEWHRLLHQAKM
jgi:hypothetical protein